MKNKQYIYMFAMLLVSYVSVAQDFTITFNTEIDDSGNTTINLPMSDGAYDVDFNNDGIYGDTDATAKELDNLTGTQTITFAIAGTYTIRIRPNSSNTSNQLRIAYAGSNSAQKLTTIVSWGTTIVWTSMQEAFSGCSNMNISATAGAPNLSGVINMDDMFSGATSFNQDISSWDVSNIVSMNYIFLGATSFNGNISTWNVSNVTTMFGVFRDASMFNNNLNSWDVSKVTDMSSMFSNATSFNQDLDSWNTSSVILMTSMFSGASAFDGNISSWNTSNVTNMFNMFNEATSFNQDLNSWDVSNVVTITQMFLGASAFDGNLSTWNTSNLLRMTDAFRGATNFNQNISGWNVSNVTHMSYAFKNATSFNQDIGNWNIVNVSFMFEMFTGATSFSAENYDNLLTGWSAQSVQSNIIFGAPPTSYCAGEAGRTDLIANHSWTINGDLGKICPMILTFNTEAGAPGNTTIILPISDGAYDVDFNNDGIYGDTDAAAQSLDNLTDTKTITFASPGIYTIRIRTNSANTSKQLRIVYADANDAQKLTTINSWGDIVWTSMRNAFRGCSNMNISATSGTPDLNMVTDMSLMFDGASKLNQDLNSWDVSKVTNMNYMFSGATIFNGNISSWNIGNVTNVSHMFSNASDFDKNIGSWDVSNVTDMSHMFSNASSFNQDLNLWNTSSATNMQALFYRASSFNGDTNNWNVSNVTSMWRMFSGASTFNQDISAWNISKVTSIGDMFKDAISFNQDLSSWNTTSVISMISTFNGATAFNQDISAWNVTSVNSMNDILTGATHFSTDNYDLLLTAWSAQNVQSGVSFGAPPTNYCDGEAGRVDLVTNHSWTITNDLGKICPMILTFNTEAGDPGNVTIVLPISDGAFDVDFNNDGTYGDIDATAQSLDNLTGTKTITFANAGVHTIRIRANSANTNKQIRIAYVNGNSSQKLTSIENWGDFVWTSMQAAFEGCSNMNISATAGVPDLSSVTDMSSMFKGATALNQDLNSWNVSNVENMNSMFSEATVFNGNVSAWNTANVTNMHSMFYRAAAFNQNIGAWNVSNVINIGGMFNQASSFNQDISSWNVSKVISLGNTFAYASAFNQPLNSWDVSNVTNMLGMFEASTSFNQDLNSWDVSKVTNMLFVFKNATAFNGNITAWNTGAATRMKEMFRGAAVFNQDLNSWNVSNVTEMDGMFIDAAIFNGNISSWNTGNVTNMNLMFANAPAFNQDISNWDVSKVTIMTGFFNGVTAFSSSNYDRLLTSWSALNVQNGVAFGAPPTSYCTGKAGRDDLTDPATHNWTITGDMGEDCPSQVSLAVKVCLQGAHDVATGMMRASLGSTHLPVSSPHPDGATTNSSVFDFDPTHNNAIVDWVHIELRDKNDITNVLYRGSGLLQRDGDVVAVDGVSVLKITAPADEYYVSITHRNHLPIAAATTLNLSNTVTTINLTDVNNVRGGVSAVLVVDEGMHALPAGDLNLDGQINNLDLVLGFMNIGNSGYLPRDLNLDGQTQTVDIIDILLKAIGKGRQF